MTIHNDTNNKRVDKIVEIVALLKKSIDSNNATPDDVWKLMEPAIDAIQAILSGERPEQAETAPEPAEKPVERRGNADSKEPVHLQLKRLCEEVDAEHLSMIMAVVMTRWDDLIYERKRK